jgi:hypothetical protein
MFIIASYDTPTNLLVGVLADVLVDAPAESTRAAFAIAAIAPNDLSASSSGEL